LSWRKQKYKWLQDPIYQLPKESDLLHNKDVIVKEYEEKIKAIAQKIENNYQKFECLHRLLVDDEEQLVNDVEKFLIWLGFENVKNMDHRFRTLRK
jgi:hypothetical protein